MARQPAVKLVTTSVVRGSVQGESHGGVFLVDFDHHQVQQKVDWNTVAIDWEGRGGDRGLRGIAIDGDTIYIAASDELFAFTPEFELRGSWRNAYLRHCHEIDIHGRTLYLTSTGFDALLAFSLDRQLFEQGWHLATRGLRFENSEFDPNQPGGPALQNRLHLNNVQASGDGICVAGLKTGGLLQLVDGAVDLLFELPPGTHNARRFRDGVLFNDSRNDQLRFDSPARNWTVPVPRHDRRQMTHLYTDFSRIARPGFARGLCEISASVVAAGSSPSTLTLYDVDQAQSIASLNLTMDVRNAIHGLAVWPF